MIARVDRLIVVLILQQVLLMFSAVAQSSSLDVSGHARSLTYVTESTGLNAALFDDPATANASVTGLGQTMSLEELRLKLHGAWSPVEEHRITTVIEYDNRPQFGNSVSSGDFAYQQRTAEERQFVDLLWTPESGGDFAYEHRLYRAFVGYAYQDVSVKVGRQQIPWGVGYFFTPTDVFNPFFSTQLQLDERQGVDAISASTALAQETKLEVVYTPDGRELHPQRFMSRVSSDIAGFETGALFGEVDDDPTAGFDLRGNIGDSAVRAECLAQDPDGESGFVQCSTNADYNWPGNVYTVVEYFFNGEGGDDKESYQLDRYIQGEILQLARNYVGLTVGHDFTPLLRGEYRQIINLVDGGVFMRPEVSYSLQEDIVILLGCQLFSASKDAEYANAKDKYFIELKYAF